MVIGDTRHETGLQGNDSKRIKTSFVNSPIILSIFWLDLSQKRCSSFLYTSSSLRLPTKIISTKSSSALNR